MAKLQEKFSLQQLECNKFILFYIKTRKMSPLRRNKDNIMKIRERYERILP